MSNGRLRILFCSQLAVTRMLGTTKVLVEAADAMAPWGWEPTIAGPEQINPAAPWDLTRFAASLREFLREHAGAFDVVDYDHGYLPYPRTEFAPGTLMVARSVLLAHHVLRIPIPGGPSLRQRIGGPYSRWKARRVQRDWVERAQRTVESADLVNVANQHDRRELIRCGIPDGKIAVLPYGIGEDRRAGFDAVGDEVPAAPTVAFVGTFDYRKGARDMPGLFRAIAAIVPGVRFKLVGTAGMFSTADQVLAHLPRSLHGRIEVVPRFQPDELPQLLRRCSVGIFPSRLEGFGIGVLEMMAAAVPVIAYDAPGPPEMVPSEWLVPPGDLRRMAAIVSHLLGHPDELAVARRRARLLSRRFGWSEIGRRTSDAYRARLSSLRSNDQQALVAVDAVDR